MERVEKIEQSVLAKAFRGELAEPDPNDEPAKELLKRIVEEKAKQANWQKKESLKIGQHQALWKRLLHRVTQHEKEGK